MASVIRASVLTGYCDLLKALGGDGEAYLAGFGIPFDISPADSRLVSFVDVARLLETSAKELQCPDLALRLAARQGVDRLGGIGVVACNASSPREALELVRRFLSLHSPSLSLHLESVGDRSLLRIVFDWLDPVLTDYPQVQEQVLGNTLVMLRMLAGDKCRPLRVLLPHEAQSQEADYSDYFDCDILFKSGYCALEFSSGELDCLLLSADPVVKRLATHDLEQQDLVMPVSLASQIRILLGQLLPGGKYQLGTVADHLSLHPRTLQRRLALEGLRYEVLLDVVRRDLASTYLADTRLALGQITGLLGYSEQSSFQRACRRWFSNTPRNHRLRLAGSSPGRQGSGSLIQADVS
ncbi:AraC family transcriptional regulator [Microbulbifer sp. OS29]|uniref:AraC family transcriptional regulator n=1 Tax=Microbulbifer okhotskensis TaxID=2926617 RepID=A0A9X2ESC9_9GAMM|nr:AraC family transcriptional regulator ligand-binding domain-containing protein [Microbulbifer okhotskensis]MCO1334743.1 AraC family transcriptional regulator [Microbulbifer okhotskensis]